MAPPIEGSRSSIYSRLHDQFSRPTNQLRKIDSIPIPTCKDTSDTGLVSTCAVCSSEFKDGEEVKVSPDACTHFVFAASICGYSLTRIALFVGPTWVSQSQPTIIQNPTPFSYRILVNHGEKFDIID
ncbi:hypothetical protein OIU78_006405 [Salix suchowensis]|nr:hypothetical protein OIU78_006405 [Salix suchowensis]